MVIWACLPVSRFESRTGCKWFVGVMANITDCRSVAMSSILIRTAIVPDSVMVNISDFDSDILSSGLSSVTK